MNALDRTLGMYLHLARASDLRRQLMVRDKLLVLSGVTACELDMPEIAAQCRRKVLAHNARHLVRRWPTLEVALEDERFLTYLKQLRRRYSPERAEHMLATLGLEMGREREIYDSAHEYAAALLAALPDAGRRHPSAHSSTSDRLISNRASAAGGSDERAGLPLVEWLPFYVGLAILASLAAWHYLWRGD